MWKVGILFREDNEITEEKEKRKRKRIDGKYV